MKNKERIDREVQRTLAHMDTPDTLPPDPYFYTRLKARIDNRQKDTGILHVMLKPAFFIALTIMNAGALAWYNLGGTTPATDNGKQFVELLVSDLQMENTSSSFISLK